MRRQWVPSLQNRGGGLLSASHLLIPAAAWGVPSVQPSSLGAEEAQQTPPEGLAGTQLSCLLVGHVMARQSPLGAEGGDSKQGRTNRLCPLSPQVAYFQSALDKLSEAIKLAKVKLRKGLLPQAPRRGASLLAGGAGTALVDTEPHPYPPGPA